MSPLSSPALQAHTSTLGEAVREVREAQDTPVDDFPAESEVRALERGDPDVPIGALLGHLHTLGCEGAVEALLRSLERQHGEAPATWGLVMSCDSHWVDQSLRPAVIRLGGTLSRAWEAQRLPRSARFEVVQALSLGLLGTSLASVIQTLAITGSLGAFQDMIAALNERAEELTTRANVGDEDEDDPLFFPID